jgi:hypothetical protein
MLRLLIGGHRTIPERSFSLLAQPKRRTIHLFIRHGKLSNICL